MNKYQEAFAHINEYFCADCKKICAECVFHKDLMLLDELVETERALNG